MAEVVPQYLGGSGWKRFVEKESHPSSERFGGFPADIYRLLIASDKDSTLLA
jgi:hypothetical protein